ncbi:MAG: DUF2207 domain-containing protein [Clostridiales bacterium]|jgi:hypothetical protein|nr:DUF2207 domain-containing protein [Clostridiales bacterium]
MKDRKVFTIIGVFCILLAIGVIIFALVKGNEFNFLMILPLIFAVSCLVIARTSK